MRVIVRASERARDLNERGGVRARPRFCSPFHSPRSLVCRLVGRRRLSFSCCAGEGEGRGGRPAFLPLVQALPRQLKSEATTAPTRRAGEFADGGSG